MPLAFWAEAYIAMCQSNSPSMGAAPPALLTNLDASNKLGIVNHVLIDLPGGRKLALLSVRAVRVRLILQDLCVPSSCRVRVRVRRESWCPPLAHGGMRAHASTPVWLVVVLVLRNAGRASLCVRGTGFGGARVLSYK